MHRSGHREVSLRGASARETSRTALLNKIAEERAARSNARKTAAAALLIQRVWRGGRTAAQAREQVLQSWDAKWQSCMAANGAPTASSPLPSAECLSAELIRPLFFCLRRQERLRGKAEGREAGGGGGGGERGTGVTKEDGEGGEWRRAQWAVLGDAEVARVRFMLMMLIRSLDSADLSTSFCFLLLKSSSSSASSTPSSPSSLSSISPAAVWRFQSTCLLSLCLHSLSAGASGWSMGLGKVREGRDTGTEMVSTITSARSTQLQIAALALRIAITLTDAASWKVLKSSQAASEATWKAAAQAEASRLVTRLVHANPKQSIAVKASCSGNVRGSSSSSSTTSSNDGDANVYSALCSFLEEHCPAPSTSSNSSSSGGSSEVTAEAAAAAAGPMGGLSREVFMVLVAAVTLALRPILSLHNSTGPLASAAKADAPNLLARHIFTLPLLTRRLPPALLPSLAHPLAFSPVLTALQKWSQGSTSSSSHGSGRERGGLDDQGLPSCRVGNLPAAAWALANVTTLAARPSAAGAGRGGGSSRSGPGGSGASNGASMEAYVKTVCHLAHCALPFLEHKEMKKKGTTQRRLAKGVKKGEEEESQGMEDDEEGWDNDKEDDQRALSVHPLFFKDIAPLCEGSHVQRVLRAAVEGHRAPPGESGKASFGRGGGGAGGGGGFGSNLETCLSMADFGQLYCLVLRLLLSVRSSSSSSGGAAAGGGAMAAMQLLNVLSFMPEVLPSMWDWLCVALGIAIASATSDSSSAALTGPRSSLSSPAQEARTGRQTGEVRSTGAKALPAAVGPIVASAGSGGPTSCVNEAAAPVQLPQLAEGQEPVDLTASTQGRPSQQRRRQRRQQRQQQEQQGTFWERARQGLFTSQVATRRERRQREEEAAAAAEGLLAPTTGATNSGGAAAAAAVSDAMQVDQQAERAGTGATVGPVLPQAWQQRPQHAQDFVDLGDDDGDDDGDWRAFTEVPTQPAVGGGTGGGRGSEGRSGQPRWTSLFSSAFRGGLGFDSRRQQANTAGAAAPAASGPFGSAAPPWSPFSSARTGGSAEADESTGSRGGSVWDVGAVRDGGATSLAAARADAVLELFCRSYAHLLLVLDDEEFYSRQMPFKLIDQRAIAATLNTLVYNSLLSSSSSFSSSSSSIPTSASLQHRQSASLSSALSKSPNASSSSLVEAATRCLHALHDRDSRRSFCPPDLWLAPPRSRPLPVAAAAAAMRRAEVTLEMTRQFEEQLDAPATVAVLKTVPHVLSFEDRVVIFRHLVLRDKAANGHLAAHGMAERAVVDIRVRRSFMVEDGFQHLSMLGPLLKGRIRVTFVNDFGEEEMGMDYGGLFKEFLTELAKAAFDPGYGLFVQTATEEGLLYPHIASAYLPHGLPMMEFLGRIVGKALYDGILLEYSFAPLFVCKLMGRYAFLDELSTLDAELHRNLMYLKHYDGDADDLALDFSVTEEVLGEHHVIELVRGGSSIGVTNGNKLQYIHAVADYKLNKQMRHVVRAFVHGLTSIIPPEWLRLFSPMEFNQLLSGGDDDVDVNDMRVHTVYSGGYSDSDRTIRLFWEVVASLGRAEKRELLKFVTSCSRPPLLGFQHLRPPFTIHRVVDDIPAWAAIGGADVDRLPTASTCHNTLKLPMYQRASTLREKLLYSIKSNAGFDLS